MLKRKLIRASVVFIMLCIFIYANNIYTLMLLLFSMFLPLFSVAACLLSKHNIAIETDFPDTFFVEGKEVLKIYVENKSVMPIALLNIELAVSNLLTGTKEHLIISFSMPGKSKCCREILISNPEVGRIFIDTENVTISDMFKLVSLPAHVGFNEEIYVFPKKIPTTVHMFSAHETYGESIKYSEHNKGNDHGEVFDLKEYFPGDDIRNIHWKLSTKSDRIMLREFSYPLNYSVVIVTEFCSESAALIEACANYAANISASLLDMGVMHTFVFYDEGVEELCVINIDSFKDYDACMQRMISTVCSKVADATLTRYYYSMENREFSQMIYITPNDFSEQAEKMSIDINIKHIIISNDNTDSITIEL